MRLPIASQAILIDSVATSYLSLESTATAVEAGAEALAAALTSYAVRGFYSTFR